MYLGQKETRSLAALIELAEMLIPRVTMSRPIAPKAVAARPACEPDSLQLPTMTIGFQMISPYAVCEAAAVKIPRRPTIVKMMGMTMTWTFCAFGVFEYLAKSAMFSPRVA